ncbi:MAG: ATP-binding cassette domain-containing protein [Bacteroidales bacterium]|nr:ATP-binding cassette domain-containing protein [Bacteroidales bacterium]
MIEVNNINKSFGDLHVLKNLSTVFEKGKINQIIGRSGSGKTVFLKSLVGLHEIDSGSILYDGRDFSKMNFKSRKEIRKEIGMVFQGGALFDSATVAENVMFPLDMFTEMSFKEKKERVDFCLKRVGILESNNLFPSEISGGMQKRVAIARAISLNPKYLFCDEPNSGLDPKTAILIDNLIKEITYEYNITTVINTHDMNSIMEIGDNIIFIYQGENIWEGSKNNIFNSDNELLNDFVFASELYKKIKLIQI